MTAQEQSPVEAPPHDEALLQNDPLYKFTYHLFQALDDGTAGVRGFAREHPTMTGAALGTVLLGLNTEAVRELQSGQGPLVAISHGINGFLSSVPGGKEVLHDLATIASGPHLVNAFSVPPDATPTDQILLALASFGQVSIEGAAFAVAGAKVANTAIFRPRRILEGREPLGKNEIPDTLFFGPTPLFDALAGTLKRHPWMPGKHLVHVLVHADGLTPATLGGVLNYHRDISGVAPGQMYDWMLAEKNQQAIGLPRARKIVFFGVDSDSALYYGGDGKAQFAPSLISTMISGLASLPPKELAGKRFLAVVPAGSGMLGGTRDQAGIFSGNLAYIKKLTDAGAQLDVITPEDVFWERRASVHITAAREKAKQQNKPIAITLVGGKDDEMLRRFVADLEHRDASVQVTILSDEMIGNTAKSTMDSRTRDISVRKMLEEVDIVYVYGETDDRTTDLTAGALQMGVSPEKTWAILEREIAMQDETAAPAGRICLYTDLTAEVQDWMKKR